MSAWCAVLLATALLASWPGTARAEDPATEQARQHYLDATKHYDLGHWDEAIAEYEKAYDLRPDPSFLYNLAQVYRRKGDSKRALDLYKNYLRKDPKSPQREEVEEKIAALQKQIDEAAAKPAPIEPVPAPAPAVTGMSGHEPAVQPEPPAPTAASAPLPPVSLPVAAGTPPDLASGAPAPVTVDTSTPPRPGRNLRIAGIVCGSVGAGAVIAGAVFGLRARSLSNRVADADKFNPSDESAGQRAETLQWTFYGIGAGAVVAGGVLYYLGLRAAQSSSTVVSLGPLVGQGTAGLSAMGVF